MRALPKLAVDRPPRLMSFTWRAAAWRDAYLARQEFRKSPGMGQEKQIGELKSLGPKSHELLGCAGIRTESQLRTLGSVEAYIRAKRANSRVSLNLLWALESALTGEPWQHVARRHRTSLLLALEDREKNA